MADAEYIPSITVFYEAIERGELPDKQVLPWTPTYEEWWEGYRGYPDDPAEEVDYLSGLIAGMLSILRYRSEGKPPMDDCRDCIWSFGEAAYALYWTDTEIYRWIQQATTVIRNCMYPIRFGHKTIC